METSCEEQRDPGRSETNPEDTPETELSDLKTQQNHHHNETVNGESNSEKLLTNGDTEEPMETENPEDPTRPETRPETRPDPSGTTAGTPEGDLSSINAMMTTVMSSAVMSSGVMSSAVMSSGVMSSPPPPAVNGAEEESAENAASANSSAGPSPSPSPNKSLTSAMRAPPSRNQRRTQESKDDSAAFICPLCDKNCQTQHQLTMHIRQHNADAGATDHSCSICGKCLSSASSLDRHMLVHSGERPYKCNICGQTFTTNGNMHRHMKIHEKDPASGLVLLSPPSPSLSKRRRPSVKRRLGEETEEPPSKKVVEDPAVEDSVAPVRTVEEELPCPICFKVLTSRLELDAHMDTHPDTALRCDSCCLSFRTHRGLLRHNAAVHKLLPLDPSGRPFIQNNPSIPTGFNELAFIDFSCKKFSHIAQVWCETNLRRCISKFHRFVCDSCDRAFPLRSALELHKTTSHSKTAEGGDEEEHSAADKKLSTEGEEERSAVGKLSTDGETKLQHKPVDEESEQESFLGALGLKHKSKIPVGPSEADLIQSRLDSIKTIPVESSSFPQEALSLGLALGVPVFQAGFLLQPEGGAPGSEAPAIMELADIQQILKVAAAAPNQIGLSLPLKGGATGAVQKSMPPLKPKPPPTSRCGLASTPPPVQNSQQASLGCISPSLPPPAPSLFKSPPVTAQTDPETPDSPSSDSPPHTTSLSPDETALNRKNSAKVPANSAKGSYPCRFCDQVFSFSGLLQAHMRFHLGILPHQCNICDYVAPDKATLIRHLRTHSGERPYVCRVCHYPFTVKANCERHLRKKHNKTSRKDIEKNIKYVTSTATNNIAAALTAAAATVANSNSQDAETVCRFCGDDLKTYRALQIHLRTHNGCQRKPFECKRCGAAFLAKRNCIHHLLKHHPEVQEREIEEHIATLQPANITAANVTANVTANANITTNRAATLTRMNGIQSVKVEPIYPSDLDQPLDFSAKNTRDSSGVKLEMFDSGAALDQPIDLSIPSKRQRREETAVEVKPELTSVDVSLLSKDDKLAANVLACFLSSGSSPSPSSSSSAASSLSCRAPRLKPLLPKPSASASAGGAKELPPLASIAQIIHSVSGATDLLRSRDTVATVTTAPASSAPGGGATAVSGGGATGGRVEVKVESEREAAEDEDHARKRPRKKPVPASKDRPVSLDLESSGEFASVEKMLATTDANKFSTYLQTAELGTKRDGAAVSAEEKPGAREEPKPSAPQSKGKKNAYSNSAQKMTCPFCPRVFPWASSLQRHMLTHTGQKPFPCPKCDAFFSTKSNCERHLLRKHGVTNRTLRRNGVIVKKEEEASQESAGSQSEAEPVPPEADSKASESSPTHNTNPAQSEPKGVEPAAANPTHTPAQDEAGAEVVPDPPQSETSEQQQEVLESSSSSSAEKQPPQNSSAKVESTDDDDCHSNKSLDLNFGRKLIDFKLTAASSGSSQDEQPTANTANNANNANPDSPAVSSKPQPEFKHVCRVCKKTFRYGTTLARHEKAHLCEEPASATEEPTLEQETGKPEETQETGNQEDDKTEEDKTEDDKVADANTEEVKEPELESEQMKGGESEGETGESEFDEKEKEDDRSDEENGSEPKNSDGNRVDKRKKICNVCGKRFWSLQDLTRHMRSHTGERPYQCQTCERTFTLKHSLVRHQRIHLKPRANEDTVSEDGDSCAAPSTRATSENNVSEDGDSCAALSTCTPSENESETKELDELGEPEGPTSDKPCTESGEKSASENADETLENSDKPSENTDETTEEDGDKNTNVSRESTEDDAEAQNEKTNMETSSESISKEAPESAPAPGDSVAESAQAEGSVDGQTALEPSPPPPEHVLPNGETPLVGAE